MSLSQHSCYLLECPRQHSSLAVISVIIFAIHPYFVKFMCYLSDYMVHLSLPISLKSIKGIWEDNENINGNEDKPNAIHQNFL